MSTLDATPEQVQFHTFRLGGRAKAAALYRRDYSRFVAQFPVTDADRVCRGEQVLIGKVLAKRCAVCWTTRELEWFHVEDRSPSGVRSTCSACRSRLHCATLRHSTPE